MTYSEVMEKAVRELTEAGFEEARTDVRELLQFVSKKSRTELLFCGEDTVPKEQVEQFCSLLDSRKAHMPVQYLTGEQEFCGLCFRVNSDVLVPRPETELLAEAVFRQAEGKRVLDMCTGSGCIAVTVAKLGKPELVAASDASEAALLVARKNASENGAEVEFFCGDLFENVTGCYDIIVSNPPYIKTAVIEGLMAEVREFEPRMALDGKEDGLYFYRRICEEAKAFLVPGGRLMFEIGHDQGETVPELLREAGYEAVEVKQDYAGLDRMVFAVWPDKNKEN